MTLLFVHSISVVIEFVYFVVKAFQRGLTCFKLYFPFGLQKAVVYHSLGLWGCAELCVRLLL